jgi:hypothetical protein
MMRLALVFWAASLVHAAIVVHWDELPKVLKGQTIEITTTDAVVHHGRFAGSQPEKILLTEGKKVEIARDAVISIRRVYTIRGNRLSKFGEGLAEAALLELVYLASPWLPVALAALPVTGAVGLVGVPIFAAWDLFDRQRRDENVVILPDPK